MALDGAKVATAAGKALGIWIAVYVVIAHIFVLWKWNASAKPSRSPALEQSIQKVQQAIADSRKRSSKLTEQLSHLGRLYRNVEDQTESQNRILADDALPRRTTADPSVLKLKQLLGVSNLADFRSSSAVSKSFNNAITDLRNHLEDPMAISALAKLLDEESQSVQRTSTCSADGDSVTFEHLQRAQAPILQALEALSNKQVPVFYPETRSELEKVVRDMIAQQTNLIHEATSDDDAKCLKSMDLIENWLGDGLYAMHQNRDVRQDLLESVKKSGVEPPILDAALFTEPVQSTPARRLTLRDILDRPSLHVHAGVVDSILVYVSGHWDQLDEVLDKHVYSHVDDHESVGRLLLDRLLQLSGDVAIPKEFGMQR